MYADLGPSQMVDLDPPSPNGVDVLYSHEYVAERMREKNLYGYVGNNPVIYVDPHGLERIVGCPPTFWNKLYGDAIKTEKDLNNDGLPDYEYPKESKKMGGNFTVYCISTGKDAKGNVTGDFYIKEPDGTYVHRCPYDEAFNKFFPRKDGGYSGFSRKPNGERITYSYDKKSDTLTIRVFDKNGNVIRHETIHGPKSPTGIPRPENVKPYVAPTVSQCPDRLGLEYIDYSEPQ